MCKLYYYPPPPTPQGGENTPFWYDTDIVNSFCELNHFLCVLWIFANFANPMWLIFFLSNFLIISSKICAMCRSRLVILTGDIFFYIFIIWHKACVNYIIIPPPPDHLRGENTPFWYDTDIVNSFCELNHFLCVLWIFANFANPMWLIFFLSNFLIISSKICAMCRSRLVILTGDIFFYIFIIWHKACVNYIIIPHPPPPPDPPREENTPFWYDTDIVNSFCELNHFLCVLWIFANFANPMWLIFFLSNFLIISSKICAMCRSRLVILTGDIFFYIFIIWHKACVNYIIIPTRPPMGGEHTFLIWYWYSE